MSAKVTVIVYILICFEIGILLTILPWYSQFWEENFFLYIMTEKLHAPWLPAVVTSGWMRGAVTGLGLINLLIGVREMFNFRESVASLNSRLTKTPVSSVSNTDQNWETEHGSSPNATTSLSDHQSSGLPPSSH